MPDDPIFDNWAWMGHKRALSNDGTLPGRSWKAPSWIPPTHERRIQAYTILDGYYKNAARHFLPSDDADARQKHREYGDAALIVHQTVAALTGDDQSIVVEGSDKYDPDFDTEPPASPPLGATDEQLDAYDAAVEEHRKALRENNEAKVAADRENQLQDWAKKERLIRKILEVERDANKLGDGVIAVTWSNNKRRPRVRVYDPGVYFPVLSDGEEDYPTRVHLAWQIETDGIEGDKKLIRRITFQLGEIGPQADFEGAPLLGEDGKPLLREGDTLSADGRITRKYPWNDEPSAITCYMTDAVFELEGKATVFDFSAERARYQENEDGDQVRNLDLAIDFIPIVHVPNTVAEKEHFGRSTVATVLQILDDLQNADTDLEGAAATSGSPAIALTKPLNVDDDFVVGPGRHYILGEGGRMDVLDSSGALDALLKYVEQLLSRLSINARIPEAVLGRLAPSEVPSGVALALAMGPLETMIREMRLVREEKYPLVLKMAQRYFQRDRKIKPGADQILEADIKFGSFLPSDRQATAALVQELRQAKAISTLTGIIMLVEAGFPIEDAAEELVRIQAEDFEGANQLLEATGNEDEVSEYLGREVRPASQPEVTLPGVTITEEEGEAEGEEGEGEEEATT